MNSSALTFDRRALKCEMAAEILGCCGSLRVRATGLSMLPTIWPGDTLIIERADGVDVAEGDIVLFRCADRFVVHRVVTKRVGATRMETKTDARGAGTVQTQGDALRRADSPISEKAVLGRVALILRSGKGIEPGRSLRRSDRAAATLFRHSELVAHIVAGVHNIRRRCAVRNSSDRVVGPQSVPCQN